RKVNATEYTTHGFEVMLNYSAFNRPSFGWDIGVNWSRYVRRLTSIYGGATKLGNLKVGDRADAYYATVWQKSAAGELILSESNGLPIRDPYPGLLGHIEPSWRLGLQNRFKVKGFSIAVDIDGVWGGLMRSLTIEKMWWGGKHPESVL